MECFMVRPPPDSIVQEASLGSLLTDDVNLATFLVTNSQPQGALAQGKDGKFYGTSTAGTGPSKNSKNRGTVFSVTPDGTISPDCTFVPSALNASTFPDGSSPYCTLIMDAAGNFYGTSSAGGWFTKGSV